MVLPTYYPVATSLHSPYSPYYSGVINPYPQRPWQTPNYSGLYSQFHPLGPVGALAGSLHLPNAAHAQAAHAHAAANAAYAASTFGGSVLPRPPLTAGPVTTETTTVGSFGQTSYTRRQSF